MSPAYSHNAPCRASNWLMACKGDSSPFPPLPLPPPPRGEVKRRHLTLSAFGCNRLACAGADEQSHQTLMCKSNKHTEVQRAGVKLDHETAPQQKPGPTPSLTKSIRQSMGLHYSSIFPPLAKMIPWRQIVSYKRPEKYRVKNWSIRPRMSFDSALCVNMATKDSFLWFIDALWRKCLFKACSNLYFTTSNVNWWNNDHFQTLFELNFAFLFH